MSNPSRYTTDFLISVLDSAGIPPQRPDGQSSQTVFRSKDGWEVYVDWSGYDGSFAVIEHLLSPDGDVIDPYEWPCKQEGGDGDFERVDEWEPKPVDPLDVLVDAAYRAQHELAKLGFYHQTIIGRLLALNDEVAA
jgi:hypothetical protein